ncbi:MAG: alpha/beta hydrolase-fold protein [Acidimicrobiia bacterium]
MPIEVHRISWRGRADGVAVKTFMPRFPHHLPMTGADGAWSADLHLPADARIEYRLEIRRGDRYESTLDPANEEVATNPFGENSVLRGSAYPPSPPSSPTIAWQYREFRVQSTALGGRRSHHLLSPVGISDREPLPLLVLHDGSDYRAHANLEAVLGAAIHAGRLPFLRVALLDPRHRDVEYSADASHAAHVVDEVLPRLRTRVGVGGQCVIGGASLGAVASWHAAWSRPGAFTGMVLQSGTFAFGRHTELPDAMATPIQTFVEHAMKDPRLGSIGVGQTCGRFESLIDWNRSVADVIGGSAPSHSYQERWTGHDWGAWSDTLVDALSSSLAR